MKKNIFVIAIFFVLTVFFWLGFSSLASPFDVSFSGISAHNGSILVQPNQKVTIAIKMKSNTQGEVIYTFPSSIFDKASTQLAYLPRANAPSCITKNTHVRCTELQKGDSLTLSAHVKKNPTAPTEYILPLRVRSKDMTGRKSTQYTPLSWNLPIEYTPAVSSVTPTPKPIVSQTAEKQSENFIQYEQSPEVYLKDNLSGTDPQTDFMLSVLPESDKNTFSEKQGAYAEDKNNFYYGNKKIDANLQDDFRYLGQGFSYKNEKIFIAFREFTEVEDPQSFSPVMGSAYSKDSQNVYYLFSPLNIEPDTFLVHEGGYASNGTELFFNGKIVNDCSANNFLYLGEHNNMQYIKTQSGFYSNAEKIVKKQVPFELMK